MIPQGYPLKVRVRIQDDPSAEWDALVVGWVPDEFDEDALVPVAVNLDGLMTVAQPLGSEYAWRVIQ